jgi:succinyl-CoA synthetase beta subunit
VRALPVNFVLISEAGSIAKELYLSVLVDRASKAVAFIASARGGVDIEQVARENPEDIHTLEVNFVQGLQPYQCRKLAFAMDLNAKQATQLTKIMLGLYRLFNEKDLALVELTPLAILTDGNLAVLDGKINSDDNANFRHPELVEMREIAQEDSRGSRQVRLKRTRTARSAARSTARAWRGDQRIGIIDAEPATPDVGGGAPRARTEAFADPVIDPVRAFVNIFGHRPQPHGSPRASSRRSRKSGHHSGCRAAEGTNVEAGKGAARQQRACHRIRQLINDLARRSGSARSSGRLTPRTAFTSPFPGGRRWCRETDRAPPAALFHTQPLSPKGAERGKQPRFHFHLPF